MKAKPQWFWKYMWSFGYRKIAAVSSISIEYSDKAAQKIKEARGYASQWVEDENDKIAWETSLPASVKRIIMQIKDRYHGTKGHEP